VIEGGGEGTAAATTASLDARRDTPKTTLLVKRAGESHESIGCRKSSLTAELLAVMGRGSGAGPEGRPIR
jgi:hypothetical protein